MLAKVNIVPGKAGSRTGRSVRIGIFIALILVSIIAIGVVPHVQPAYASPQYTISYYERAADYGTMYNQGSYEALLVRSGPPNGIVVLAFGQPQADGVSYGTVLFDRAQSYASTDLIAAGVEAWADGYYHNSTNSYKIRIAIGTNNQQFQTGQVNSGHGRTWAAMVNNVADYVRNAGYSAKLTVSGANDIEANWSDPGHVFDWIGGWQYIAQHVYYDYGDAAGCYGQGFDPNGIALCNHADTAPTYHPQPAPCQYATNGYPPVPWSCYWNVDDIYRKAFGVGNAYALPEIYVCCQGHNWAHVSYDGLQRRGAAIVFSGALTNWCQDQEGLGCPPNGNPSVYSPGAGWLALWNALNYDYPGISQNGQLGWSSDIQYSSP